MKVTEITTDHGTYHVEQIPCSMDRKFDAQGCYDYCMRIGPDADFWRAHYSRLLVDFGTKVSEKSANNTEWYKNRHNFRDVETEDER